MEKGAEAVSKVFDVHADFKKKFEAFVLAFERAYGGESLDYMSVRPVGEDVKEHGELGYKLHIELKHVV